MKKRYNVELSNAVRYFFKLINGNAIVFKGQHNGNGIALQFLGT